MKAGRIVISVAVLTVCGGLGLSPDAVQASSAGWTLQAPAVHPFGRYSAAMAYDAATGTVVMFGGEGRHGLLDQTWSWDGTTWTQLTPAAHPPALAGAAMAYDAATGTVVMFGGEGRHGVLHQTWSWDGTTWTQLTPVHHPVAREFTAMAYDAATGTVVLFGGLVDGQFASNDTWTWDGTTWTRQPFESSGPGVRWGETMAYDAATGTVVMFGGAEGPPGRSIPLNDTWTWDGTTWTQQNPEDAPAGRWAAAMAYDAATGTAVLFGGDNQLELFADTWAWDGTTWTKQTKRAAPQPYSREFAAMAYDAATGTAVLFGGEYPGVRVFPDTWTWG
jgi:hypothetical protein